MAIAALSGWTREQKHVVVASFLGWSLDAFDFFLLVFVLKDIAAEFQTDISNVTLAILLTLAMRPIGAFIFGRAADRWGRRPTLMVNILLVFDPRIRFGLCAEPHDIHRVARTVWRRDGRRMGCRRLADDGDHSAACPRIRLGPAAIGLSRPATSWPRSSTALLFPYIGWRGMFMVGVIPALLVLYIRRNVPESPSWSKEAAVERGEHPGGPEIALAAGHLRHRSDDGVQLLQPWHPGSLPDFSAGSSTSFSPHAVGIIAVIYNIGAICGGILFGSPVGAFRQAADDHHRSPAVFAGDPAMGLLGQPGPARGRRLPDAIHGAGRLGRDSGPFE